MGHPAQPSLLRQAVNSYPDTSGQVGVVATPLKPKAGLNGPPSPAQPSLLRQAVNSYPDTSGQVGVVATPLKPKAGLNGPPSPAQPSLLRQAVNSYPDTSGRVGVVATPLKPKAGLNGPPSPARVKGGWWSDSVPPCSRQKRRGKGGAPRHLGSAQISETDAYLDDLQ